MKIVVLDGYTLNPGDISWDGLKKIGDLTVYDRTPEDKIVERIGDAEVVFTNKTPLTKSTFEKTNIKYVGVLATGYNVVDVDSAKEYNIVVTNIPTYGTSSVAQMTFALLLEICQHVGHHSDSVKAGDWAKSDDWCYWHYPLTELAGKTMGIIGYGRIGQAVGLIAQAFGMNILAYDEYKKPELENENVKYASLDELFQNSDVISLHCPLFESTKGIINKNNISKMKDGVIILNTSRGPLIVEEDLADALNSGKVYACGVDVLEMEPPTADNVLIKAKNSVVTPHISWAPKESRQRLMELAVENLSAFLKNKPQNVVNK